MTTRIKRDEKGYPIRNKDGLIIRTKPNTKTGLMVAGPMANWTDEEIDGRISSDV